MGTIRVTVKPASKKREVELLPDGRLRIKLSSPPTQGKANKELIETLAEIISVPKSYVTIIRGAGARDKVVDIYLMDEKEIAERIKRWFGPEEMKRSLK